jgi:hypothetical protein
VTQPTPTMPYCPKCGRLELLELGRTPDHAFCSRCGFQAYREGLGPNGAWQAFQGTLVWSEREGRWLHRELPLPR